MVQAPGGDAPDDEVGEGRDPDVRIARVICLQDHPGGRDAEALDGELAVEDGDDDAPVARLERPVDDQLIPVARPAASMESPETRTT